jgi:hypothetical protein
MKNLLLGVLVVLAGALAVLAAIANLPSEGGYQISQQGTVFHFAGTLLVVPMLAAWLTAEVIRLMRRPRVLDARVPGFAGRFVRGMVIGLIALTVSTALLVLFENNVSDWLLSAGGMVLAMSAGVMLTGSIRAGRCVRCEYDLAGVTPASKGLCPECGCDLLKTA